MNFSIDSLEITADKGTVNKNKTIYKNLVSNTKYLFHKREADFHDFFGKNITVQAIVGKNGSGKSSLMDVMYILVNNLAFFLTTKLNLPAASYIYYIPNLYAELRFSIDSEKYTLSCKDNNVYLKGNNKEFCFDSRKEDSFCDDTEVKEIADCFFYTIVSNYSLQSFISSNYVQTVYDYESEKQNISWIDSIFHKNDGYICPIVLNPFRGEGKIDLKKEMELSKDRLTSLLIWFNFDEKYKDNSPFKPYLYSYVKIKEKENFVNEKFKEYFENKNKLIKNISDKKIVDFVNAELKNGESFLRKALDVYSVTVPDEFSALQKQACAYLLLKLVFIPQRYSFYSDFENSYELQIEDDKLHGKIKEKETIEEFLGRIKDDKSHITKKVRRVVHFLKITSSSVNTIDGINSIYKELFSKREGFSSPSKIDEYLPPSIFSYELFLNKAEKREIIPYSGLSSGEIQMLQTLSIHTYHIENLISVPKNDSRPKYKNIALVFDEVEICFHPEYQRQFVKRLLTVLKAIIEAEQKIQNEIAFSVFIITHSPFILSDIPVNTVLFLEDGKPREKNDSETFAGNIGEMFYDSFFLKSTIGAFAEEKIKQLIQKKQGKETRMTNDEAEIILESIGDSVIKALIRETGKGLENDKN